MPGGFDELAGASESESRHIVVNALILPLRNQVGFMPNTHIATDAGGAAKSRPSRQMGEIRLLRVSSEIPKGFPILKK